MKGYKTFRVTIAGPTYMSHNGQLADPLNQYAKAIKQLTSKRKKTEADIEAIAKLEWEGGMYLSTDGHQIVPSRVLESHIVEGARKAKEGKIALAGLFVDTDARLLYAGGPITIDEMRGRFDEFRDTRGVRVGQSRVMRTRPIFRDWSATFDASIHTSMVNPDHLLRWLEAAATEVGLGELRPRYGRYVVTAFDEIKTPLKAAA